MIKTMYNINIKMEGIAMVNKKNSGGRPAGRRKTAKIEISIEPNVKEEFMSLLHEQGKNASVEMGLWIREYLKDHAYEVNKERI